MELKKDIKKDTVSLYNAKNDFYEHARKIVVAIYLLSDLFDDHEPLKWSLRSKVLDVMSHTGVFSRSVGTVAKDIDGEDAIEMVSEIRSLLDVGVLSGLVSPMNHEILSREISVFQENALRHLHLLNGNQSVYTESLFSGFDWSSVPQIASESKGQNKKTSHKGHLLDNNKLEHKKDNSSTQKTKKDHAANVHEDRKEKILQAIRDRGSAMIKDISVHIPDVSEKTIQRDLIALVAQGRISKSGERRWTVYSLAK